MLLHYFQTFLYIIEIGDEGMSYNVIVHWRINTNPESAKWQLIQSHEKYLWPCSIAQCFFYIYNFFNVYLFLRERERE